MKVILDLPVPPSNNVYYRRSKFSTYLSEAGRKYKTAVADIISEECFVKFGNTRLRVHINYHPATKRKRDLDGIFKGLLDSLQEAGVYDDDEQIDDLRIVRAEPVSGGRITIVIEGIE
jgi:crossover junction endodeoxyribonuclease RusA